MGASDYHADTDFELPDGTAAAVNLTAAPLFETAGKPIGCMLVLEDITREKRVRNTMARYVAKEVVDKLVASGQDFLRRAFPRRDRAGSPTSGASRRWPRRWSRAGNRNDAQRLFHQHG